MAGRKVAAAAREAESEDEVAEIDCENPFGKPAKKKGKRQQDEASEAENEDLPRDMYKAIDVREMLTLKPDHASRPALVMPDHRIFLETFSPVYKQAYDFIIAIAEPETRPELIHIYRLTPYSLYAAAAIGLRTDNIITYLDRFCKTNVPENVVETIRTYTRRMGKVRLVLKGGHYFIESKDSHALQLLLSDKVIQSCRATEVESVKASRASDIEISGMAATLAARRKDGLDYISDEDLLAAAEAAERAKEIPEDIRALDPFDKDEEEDETEDVDTLHFQLRDPQLLYTHLGPGAMGCKCGDVPCKKSKGSAVYESPSPVEIVQKRCSPDGLDFPLMAEYDFESDKSIPNVDMELRPTCLLRPYQEKSLKKMFGSGRALSGIIVLPCGAGKTLTGVAAACTVKKPTIVLCTSGVAVEQWCNEFTRWCKINPNLVCKFTSDDREVPPDNCILVCTYSILAQKTARSPEAQRVMDSLLKREWGMMILDEVQTAPAKEFRTLLTRFPAHCKLGLTATLVREDDKITDLRFLIGPKLYEANWIDLQESGHIARVKVSEVWCPMTPAFYAEYLVASHNNLRLQLFNCNPSKFNVCEFLIRSHEKAGDKIIVFSDDIFALCTLAEKLGKPYIHGGTSSKDRLAILYSFKKNTGSKTLFISKIGDNSFDIPDANVLIQISSHGGSRRQEAQRLGRVLRAKKVGKTKKDEYNAYFYTVISQDTKEMAYSTARQRFLVDQGYSYKVLKASVFEELMEKERAEKPFAFDSDLDQQNLLRTILTNKSRDQEERSDFLIPGFATSAAIRRERGIGALSGADGSIYQEVRSNRPTATNVHRLFKNREKMRKEFAKRK